MPPETGSAPPAARSFVPGPLWLALWLSVPLLASKAAHWTWPPPGQYGWGVWLRDLYVSSHADVAYAAAFGLTAWATLLAARRWPRVEAAAGWCLLALGAVSAVYAVASIQIFAYLRSPLTYPLLYLAGDAERMSSSIGSFLTPGIAVGMLAAPAGYALLVWATTRRDRRPPSAFRRSVPAALLVAAASWAGHGAHLASGRWSDRSDVLIARNPHWTFLASVAGELSGGDGVPELKDSFPPEFLEDFRPGEARGRAALLPAATPAPDGARERPRNVIVFMLESASARYLSLYGSPYRTTPFLDAEAAHAWVFDAYYCHVGLTANALFSMTLSVHPYMTWREYTKEYPDFPGESVADVLSPLGYRTAFLTTSFLDYVGYDRFLRDRGFDDVLDWKGLGGGEALNSWGGTDDVLVDRTLEWIDRDRGRPFYAVAFTNQTHHPYDPAPGQRTVDFFERGPRPADEYDLGRYLNALAESDRQVGRLFAGLRARGLDRDTVVIVTGDHGEAFGDPHPTWGHGFRLYDENVRVPLMVWSPALLSQARRVSTVGGHVDLNPTILDLLDVAPPGSWEGRSLFAADRPPRAYFYAANDRYLLGVREGRFKYVYDATHGREELFDLASDPDERHDVAAAHPEKCRTLRSRLAAWKHHAAERLARALRGQSLSADLGTPASAPSSP